MDAEQYVSHPAPKEQRKQGNDYLKIPALLHSRDQTGAFAVLRAIAHPISMTAINVSELWALMIIGLRHVLQAT
ncbi:hypothetical protein RHMOL_Rhmol04G0281100 [Rhododendron molle]|uniref:Uncharacterized protein n=1 Tax=Rhododendron molle TaxID=49168 RepID=A0ACC0P6J5_RHOML|nr:hypothetical protein RHMOL_Rhmol04G0281100 [Rhododendron molle]